MKSFAGSAARYTCGLRWEVRPIGQLSRFLQHKCYSENRTIGAFALVRPNESGKRKLRRLFKGLGDK
jgi:hypothetical protein